MVLLTQSRPIHHSRFHTRRAKSLLRNPLFPSPFRPKFESPSFPPSTSCKRTFSLISGENPVGEEARSELKDLLVVRDKHIYRLNEEIVELKAGERRRDGVSVSMLEHKVRSLEEDNEGLMRENEKLTRKLVEIQAKIDQASDLFECQKSDFEEKIALLSHEIASLKVENSDWVAKDRSSKDDLTKLSAILKDMKVMNTTLEDKIATVSIDMEQANKEKYELSLRLQAICSVENIEKCTVITADTDIAQMKSLIEMHQNRVSFLEKHREVIKNELTEERKRYFEKCKESETVFASLNRQITDLNLSKSHWEITAQQMNIELDTTKTKLAKAKVRINELKKVTENLRSQTRTLQTDLFQAKSDLSAHKSNQKDKNRELESLKIKIATAMEALWLKETEILRKESIKLRLEDELQILKSRSSITCKR